MTKTIHISYDSDTVDRGHLFLVFRSLKGFDLFAFYMKYCFVRFNTAVEAHEALVLIKAKQITGISSILPAKHNYQVRFLFAFYRFLIHNQMILTNPPVLHCMSHIYHSPTPRLKC